MSHLLVVLSSEPAAPQWGEKALLSFNGEQATIHLPNEGLQLRQIKKAARQLENMSLNTVKLSGEWDPEQQWAFSLSFSSAKK